MSQDETEPATADLPRWCLAHCLWDIPDDSRPRRDYDLYRIEIPRPADGHTTAPIVCGTCGLSLRCTVSSRAEMRRQGRRNRTLGLKLIAGGAAYFIGVGFLLAAVTPGNALLTVVTLLSFPAFISVLFGVVFVIIGASTAYGVWLQRDSGHSLRRPGATRHIEYHGVPGQ